MTIKSRNTYALPSSFVYSEDLTEFKYQANTELYVEGNTYSDLFTPKTIFDLVCRVDNMVNLQKVTESQVEAWVAENYKPIL